MRSIMEQEKTKHIILGITGGIAAYKAAELLRLLIKQNIEVQVVMTEAACHFITPTTMQGLSGKPVMTSQWDASVPDSMAHIHLSRAADAIVICLLYTSDAADDLLCVDLGGRRIIKK